MTFKVADNQYGQPHPSDSWASFIVFVGGWATAAVFVGTVVCQVLLRWQ